MYAFITSVDQTVTRNIGVAQSSFHARYIHIEKRVHRENCIYEVKVVGYHPLKSIWNVTKENVRIFHV